MASFSFSSRLFSTVGFIALGAAVAAGPFPAHAEEKAGASPAAMTGAPKDQKDYVILDVDGEKIYYSTVVKIWNGLFPEGAAPEFSRFDEKVRQNVLRGVISEHLIYKQAKASGLENSPQAKEVFERLKQKLLSQMFLDQKTSGAVTEAAIRAEYDKRAQALKGKQEVRARHILVATEDEAKEIENKLKAGEDFEGLAREKSTDRASAAKGGDLGYFDEGEMIEEFTKAAFALEKGKVSAPVKTEFGWHVIRVEDKRDATLPPFEKMKEKISNELKAQVLNNYIRQLVDTAHVKYYDASGKEQELTKMPDAAKTTAQ